MWPITALVISIFGLVGLVLLGNALDGDPLALEHSWNGLFIPYYIALGICAFYIFVTLVWVCTGCCQRRRRRTINVADTDNDDESNSSSSSSYVKRKSLADYSTTTAVAVDNNPSLGVDPGTFGERFVHGVDAAVGLLFIALFVAALAVLANTLEEPLPTNWTAFFVLLFIIEVLYLIVLLVGALQTCAIEYAPTGNATPGVALLGGVICCCSGESEERALEQEAAESYDRNAGSDVARLERYERRAQFQDRPCVYCCVPYALPSIADWFLALLLWLLPIALIISTALLYHRLTAIADMTPALTEPLEIELTRVFMGRTHHIAKTLSRPLALAATLLADSVITLGQVFIPLFIVEGLLVLQSLCLVFGCCIQGRSAAEWFLGLIYELWLVLVIVFQILLVLRIDNPPAEGEPIDSWHTTFAPLYALFITTIIVVGFIVACAMPPTYDPDRAYVSLWGVVVYKKQ